MRICDEPNVKILRQKACILENENSRLARITSKLLRENMILKGMGAKHVEQNLPGLLSSLGTSINPFQGQGGSEKRPRDGENSEKKKKKKKRGHGPTKQTQLEIIPEVYDLDEADKICPACGGNLKEWKGHEDETESVDVVDHQWRILRRKQKKYRCICGGCMETAEVPQKLIPGGRYTPAVAIYSSVAKFIDAIPMERQVRQARRQGAKLTSQALWDQQYALVKLLRPLVAKIGRPVGSGPPLG